MKVLVTGSRHWDNMTKIANAFNYIEQHYESVTLIIQGGAKGADEQAYLLEGRWIGSVTFPAHWRKNGRYNPGAGPQRNRLMLDTSKPDLVAAFPLPSSKGTIDMMNYAKLKGYEVLNFGAPFPNWPTTPC